jgi:hypothetical protein
VGGRSWVVWRSIFLVLRDAGHAREGRSEQLRTRSCRRCFLRLERREMSRWRRRSGLGVVLTGGLRFWLSESFLLPGSRSGRVGFMACRPAGVVVQGRSLAQSWVWNRERLSWSCCTSHLLQGGPDGQAGSFAVPQWTGIASAGCSLECFALHCTDEGERWRVPFVRSSNGE